MDSSKIVWTKGTLEYPKDENVSSVLDYVRRNNLFDLSINEEALRHHLRRLGEIVGDLEIANGILTFYNEDRYITKFVLRCNIDIKMKFILLKDDCKLKLLKIEIYSF